MKKFDTGTCTMSGEPAVLGLHGTVSIDTQQQAGLNGTLVEGRVKRFFRVLAETAGIQVTVDVDSCDKALGDHEAIFAISHALGIACVHAGFHKAMWMAGTGPVHINLHRDRDITAILQVNGETIVRSRHRYRVSDEDQERPSMRPDHPGRMRDEIAGATPPDGAPGYAAAAFGRASEFVESVAVALRASVTVDLMFSDRNEIEDDAFATALGECLRGVLFK